MTDAGERTGADHRIVAPAGGARLRVVQVGAGGMGRQWLQAVAEDPDVELVGVVDLDEQAARDGAAAHGAAAEASTDLGELIERVRPDAVIDVTIPRAHHPVTTQALFAGIPVLGEKPVALTVAEGLSLAAAAEITGELFMVSQSRRYNDQLVALKRRAADLGGVGIVTTEFFKAPHFGGFREEMDDVLLLDMAVHQFDAVRYLLDADPVSVSCESYNPAWSWYRGDAGATAVFTFEGGVRYVYTGSWCSPGAETSWNGSWRLSGAHGTALWDGDHAPTSDVPDAPDGPPAEPAAAESVGVEIAGSLRAFVRALRTGERPHGEVHGNVMSLAMVEAAIESKDADARVAIDDVLERAHATALADERRDDVRARLESWRGQGVRRALQGQASAGAAAVARPAAAE
ncbi:Gfo/Idh/MocA family protein [Clavibacter tessellarius]|uniref:Gfo/Idh/MocA family protein n=1 Tax=Clavibacter tessellarius TaxID=31965 RepID=UPI0039E824EE